MPHSFCLLSDLPNDPCVLEMAVLRRQALQEGKSYRISCSASLEYSWRTAYITYRGNSLAPSLGFLSDIVCNRTQYVRVSLP